MNLRLFFAKSMIASNSLGMKEEESEDFG